MYIYVYVYMYIYIYYVNINTYTYINIHTNIYIYTHTVYIYSYLYIYIYIHISMGMGHNLSLHITILREEPCISQLSLRYNVLYNKILWYNIMIYIMPHWSPQWGQKFTVTHWCFIVIQGAHHGCGGESLGISLIGHRLLGHTSVYHWLVVWTPLKNIKVTWDDYSQTMEK